MNSHSYKWSTPILWGGALFSMFFGAGNMIYSLWLGYIVDRHNYWAGVSAFLLSAVLFPLIGLIGIWTQRGCVFSFLAPIRSRPLKIGVLLFILSIWGPLGAMPRAIILTYSSLQPFLPTFPLAIGHLMLTVLVGLLVTNPQRMIQWFGKWLTPGLLITSIILFGAALAKKHSLSPSEYSSMQMAWSGMQLGYQTMDGLAAIFFGKLLVEMFAQQHMSKRDYRRFFAITFMTALLLLAGVYLMLIEACARLSEEIQVSSPISLMIEMSSHALGSNVGFFVALLMTGAALSTAVALALILADFLHANVVQGVSRSRIIWSIMALTYVVSLFGIEGVHALSGPALQILYPTLIALSLYLIIIHRPLSSLRNDARILEDDPS